MQKIPTIFVRDFANRGQITQEWNPLCTWVRDGEGIPTRKWDGTCCRWDGTQLWKRREIKPGQERPVGFEPSGKDEETGKEVGWVLVGSGPDDQWHREALVRITSYDFSLADLPVGTYELVGPNVNGNKDKAEAHSLVKHGTVMLDIGLRTFAGICEYLSGREIEGIVFKHPDGRMAKIKRRDFGLEW